MMLFRLLGLAAMLALAVTPAARAQQITGELCGLRRGTPGGRNQGARARRAHV
jgi:hypothetical protein